MIFTGKLYREIRRRTTLKSGLAFLPERDILNAEEQKTQMRNELNKLDRTIWNGRKTELLRAD